MPLLTKASVNTVNHSVNNNEQRSVQYFNTDYAATMQSDRIVVYINVEYRFSDLLAT